MTGPGRRRAALRSLGPGDSAMAFFLILRGPLGAGKTTIARALAEAIGGEVMSIDAILDQWEWDGGSESLFLRASRVAAERALPVLERGRPVIFDGNFYWESAIEELPKRLAFPHRAFDLKVPLQTCIERDGGREHPHGEKSAREVFEKVARFAYGIPVDATRTIALVVGEIESHLPSGWIGG